MHTKPLEYMHNKNISIAAKNSSVKRRCPTCRRYGALGRILNGRHVIGYRCRWCSFNEPINNIGFK